MPVKIHYYVLWVFIITWSSITQASLSCTETLAPAGTNKIITEHSIQGLSADGSFYLNLVRNYLRPNLSERILDRYALGSDEFLGSLREEDVIRFEDGQRVYAGTSFIPDWDEQKVPEVIQKQVEYGNITMNDDGTVELINQVSLDVSISEDLAVSWAVPFSESGVFLVELIPFNSEFLLLNDIQPERQLFVFDSGSGVWSPYKFGTTLEENNHSLLLGTVAQSGHEVVYLMKEEKAASSSLEGEQKVVIIDVNSGSSQTLAINSGWSVQALALSDDGQLFVAHDDNIVEIINTQDFEN